MKSEKEIKEKIKWLKEKENKIFIIKNDTLEEITQEEAKNYSLYEVEEVNDIDQTLTTDFIIPLEWVLKGESRYSIKELQKLEDLLGLWEFTGIEGYDGRTQTLINLIKENPKKVKEILEE